jgi:hypothetical protein
VKVFIPKWMNMVSSSLCQASCCGDGTGANGGNASEARATLALIRIAIIVSFLRKLVTRFSPCEWIVGKPAQTGSIGLTYVKSAPFSSFLLQNQHPFL